MLSGYAADSLRIALPARPLPPRRLPVLPRRHAGEPPEGARKMGLAGKSRGIGDAGQALAPVRQVQARPGDAALQHESVRRQAGRLLEGPAEMIGAEMGDR